MADDSNFTTATKDRIPKAKTEWALVRKNFATNIDLPIKLRLVIPHAAIGSILLYILHLFRFSKTNYAKMESAYAKCTKSRTHGVKKFDPDIKRKTNKNPNWEQYIYYTRPIAIHGN